MKQSGKISIHVTIFHASGDSTFFKMSPEDYFYFDDLLEGSDAVFSEPEHSHPY